MSIYNNFIKPSFYKPYYISSVILDYVIYRQNFVTRMLKLNCCRFSGQESDTPPEPVLELLSEGRCWFSAAGGRVPPAVCVRVARLTGSVCHFSCLVSLLLCVTSPVW